MPRPCRKIREEQLLHISNLRYECLMVVLRYLEENCWVRARTASELGISPRSLQAYIKDLKFIGVHIPPSPLNPLLGNTD